MPDEVGNVDAADIVVTDPPAGWTPLVQEDDLDPAAVRDFDVEADS